MKFCVYCKKRIDETLKFAMFITKKANQILDFQAFHPECYKEFYELNVRMGVDTKLKELRKIEN